jgi:hypothetical protein
MREHVHLLYCQTTAWGGPKGLVSASDRTERVVDHGVLHVLVESADIFSDTAEVMKRLMETPSFFAISLI